MKASAADSDAAVSSAKDGSAIPPQIRSGIRE